MYYGELARQKESTCLQEQSLGFKAKYLYRLDPVNHDLFGNPSGVVVLRDKSMWQDGRILNVGRIPDYRDMHSNRQRLLCHVDPEFAVDY